MNSIKFDTVNLICGLLLAFVGVFFAVQSQQLELGTAFRMGPGYFPLVLSGIMILLGIVVLVQAFLSVGEPIGAIAWRGMFFILLAPILFGLTVRGLGFVPALFVASLLASFASSRMKPLTALALAAAITVFSVIVFSYGLGLPFRRFGPWLGL